MGFTNRIFREFVFALSVLFLLLPSVSVAESAILQLAFKDGDNNTVKLADFDTTKPYYLKFWASWCKPCMEQMPHLKHAMDVYSDKINILSVNIALSESDKDIDQVMQRFGFSTPVYKDTDGHLRKALNFAGTPYHVLINTDGNVVYTSHDANTDLDRKLMLLAESNNDKLPPINLSNDINSAFTLSSLIQSQNRDQSAIVMFTATWCDWYLAESRPLVSNRCVNTQKLYQSLTNTHDNYLWSVVVSHLWTDQGALDEFRDKYKIDTPMAIDSKGDAFFALNIANFPTFVVFKDGLETYRTQSVEELTAYLK